MKRLKGLGGNVCQGGSKQRFRTYNLSVPISKNPNKGGEVGKEFLARAILFALLIMVVAPASTLRAQVPDPDTIQAVAVYQATPATTDTLPDSLVNYNVTDPVVIDGMFSGIEADTVRDCSHLQADNSAYVYVKFDSGAYRVYHLFLRWSHFSARGERAFCYYVAQASRDLFLAYSQ
jgi:hypothetical protein